MLEAVSGTLEELHIHENALQDVDFTVALLPTIAAMPHLRYFNMARNGQLTQASSVGLLQKMQDRWVATSQD